MVARSLAQFSPGRIIVLSLVGIIALAATALALPWARLVPVSFIDLIFTATSALCVTGLWSRPLTDFSTYGHGVIMVLMQIGGLGLITLTIFLLSLFTELGFTMQLMVGKILDLETWRGLKQLLLITVITTTTVELVGVLCFFPTFVRLHSPGYALFLSLFHAISSFCNAGITLTNDNLIPYQNHYFFLTITALLIFVGGIGFFTINECIYYVQSTKKRHFLSLHSKLVLYGSFTLLCTHACILLFTEYYHAFAHLGIVHRIFYAFFHAIAWRSAGFFCLALHTWHSATLFFAMGIAFIGSAPLSTGSGIKITTFMVWLNTLRATIFGTTSIDMYGRHVPDEQVHKAATIVSLSVLWIFLTTFLLMLMQEQGSCYQLFIEAVSAFTNLGIDQGITPFLSPLGKIIIILSMIAGRVGSLVLVLAILDFAYKRRLEKTGFSYPEERVMLG